MRSSLHKALWTGMVLIMMSATGMTGATETAAPPELGLVKWGRSFEAAQQAAKTSGKPILALFQEIPGCSTCVNFGQGPMSHPLIVEAIETEFVPVAIYNNKTGVDAELLERFEEPSWNNPVMRVLSADGTDVLPRRDRLWSTSQVAHRLVEALEAHKTEVPKYLQVIAAEAKADEQSREHGVHATFAMHCYWEGEARIGALDGVITTRAGWVGNEEVVEVVYDPARITYDTLLERASMMQCATTVYAHNDEQLETAKTQAPDRARQAPDAGMRDARDSDQHYRLLQTSYRFLPLTSSQATKVNAALAADESPWPWFSPRQRDLMVRIRTRYEQEPDAFKDLKPAPNKPGDWADYLVQLEQLLTP